MDEITQRKVAMKVLNRRKIRKQRMETQVKREVKAMQKLTHPNIISLYQVIESPSDLFLVMELAEGGDMYTYLVENERVSKLQYQSKFSLMVYM